MKSRRHRAIDKSKNDLPITYGYDDKKSKKEIVKKIKASQRKWYNKLLSIWKYHKKMQRK